MTHHLSGLKDRRTAMGISVATLASSIGVGLQSYYRYERGERGIGLGKAKTIARMLDCSVEDLGKDISLGERLRMAAAFHGYDLPVTVPGADGTSLVGEARKAFEDEALRVQLERWAAEMVQSAAPDQPARPAKRLTAAEAKQEKRVADMRATFAAQLASERAQEQATTLPPPVDEEALRKAELAALLAEYGADNSE